MSVYFLILLLVYAVPPLLSLLAPFVLALIVAWLLNPTVRWLQRKLSVSRKILSMILIILIFCIIGGLLYGVGHMVVSQTRSLFENWSSVMDALLGMVDSVVAALNRLGDFVPAGVLTTGEGLAESLSNWLRGLDISGWLTSLAGRAPSLVSGVSSFAISTVVVIMASYFITSDYPRLRFLLTDRVPADTRTFCGTVKRIFMEAFGGYLKSQLLLSLGVFVILAFIPIIGAGTVMIPWAVVDLIIGNYVGGIQLLVIWGIIALFRRMGEPKILGDQTGLSPILSLLGIYVGMKVGGVLGMIVGPLLLLVLINLAKLGIFRPVMDDLSMAFRDIAAILKAGRREEK